MDLIIAIATICSINMPWKNQIICQKHHVKCVDDKVRDYKNVKLTEVEALKMCIEDIRDYK